MLLKILIVDELPEWIIASDEAAYIPHLKTIWLRRDCVGYVFHELCHWAIDCLLSNNPKYHRWIDRHKIFVFNKQSHN